MNNFAVDYLAALAELAHANKRIAGLEEQLRKHEDAVAADIAAVEEAERVCLRAQVERDRAMKFIQDFYDHVRDSSYPYSAIWAKRARVALGETSALPLGAEARK
jgi:hypothetical protein